MNTKVHAADRPELVRRMLQELDRLDVSRRGGTYLTFVNAQDLAQHHSLSGVIRAVGGAFTAVDAGALEPGESVRLGEARDSIAVTLTLANQPNPIGQSPAIVVEMTRLQFKLDPPTARLRLELEIDGAPLAARQVRLGPLGTALGPQEVLELSTLDPRIRSSFVSGLRRLAVNGVYVQVQHVAATEASAVMIDEDIDRRLRALGYTGDETE